MEYIVSLISLTDKEVEQVLIYGGRDVICDSMLQAVTHLASCILHLHPTHPCTCDILLKGPSGKVIKTVSENNDIYP